MSFENVYSFKPMLLATVPDIRPSIHRHATPLTRTSIREKRGTESESALRSSHAATRERMMLLAQVRDSKLRRDGPGPVGTTLPTRRRPLRAALRPRPRPPPSSHLGRPRAHAHAPCLSLPRPLAGPFTRSPARPHPFTRSPVALLCSSVMAAWAAAANQRRPCPRRSRSDRVIWSSYPFFGGAKNKLFLLKRCAQTTNHK